MTRKMNLSRVLFIMVIILFAACSKEDEPKGGDGADNVPQVVSAAFEKQFPNATNVKWMERNKYYVANFELGTKSRATVSDAQKNEAWYTPEGKCNLSELDLSSAELESDYANVFAAWKATAYFAEGYVIDDIDLLQRTENKDDKIVKIEIEKGESERNLYFTLEGKLVKDVIGEDDSDDNEPCPQELVAYIEKNYQGAVIVDFEKDEDKDGPIYEVEILVRKNNLEIEKELIFNKDYQFVAAEIELDDEVLLQLIDKILTSEQKEKIVQLTGESDPEEWEIEITEDKDGIVTVSVEDKNGNMVEIMRVNADFQPVN